MDKIEFSEDINEALKDQVEKDVVVNGLHEAHIHLIEGVLGVDDLKVVAQKVGVELDDKSWEFIGGIMGEKNPAKDLPSFIGKLCTPGVRIIEIAKIRQEMARAGGEINPEQLVRVQKDVLIAVEQTALDKLDKSGVTSVEGFASPHALTGDGDLSDLKYLYNQKTDNGLPLSLTELKSFWDESSSKLKEAGALMSLEDYFEALDEGRKKLGWKLLDKDFKTGDIKNRYVSWRACLRRERKEGAKIGDKFGLQVPELSDVYRLIHLYERGLLAGVDLAGNEGDAKTMAEVYRPVFAVLKENHVRTSNHAGEKKLGNTINADFEIGLNNITTAIDFGVDRIGHGTFLLYAYQNHDNQDLSEDVRKDLAELCNKGDEFFAKGGMLEICLTSNQLTNVAEIKNHPVFAALKKRPDLISHILICTDDPAVAGDKTNLFIEELVNFCMYSGLPVKETLVKLRSNADKTVFRHTGIVDNFS